LQKTTAELTAANTTPRAAPSPAAAPMSSGMPAVPHSAGPSQSAAHSDLVRSLEMTGMASVAAARAVQAAASGVNVAGSKPVRVPGFI
jgi:hypothetical protein